MRNIRVKILMTSFALLFTLGQTSAQIEVIDKIFQTANKDNFSTDKKSQDFVSDHFNFDKMSKLILGSELKKQSAKEVKWFTNQIKSIIRKTINKKATDFLRKVKFQHEYVEKGKSKSSILTIVSKRGEESEVITKMEKEGDLWKITDISIDDESWTENIRTQVHKSIKEKGWKGLKDSLKKRLDELEKN